MTARRITISDLQRMRKRREAITMITAYDYPTARLVDEARIPIILVGDSLGMVVLGYESTLPVTVDDMVHHGRAVVRGTSRAHVVVDMPFGSYQGSPDDALRNAVRIMQETGCGSVKLEGGVRSAATVEHLVNAGIPVMGHVGLTPQSVNAFGGYKVQGRTPRDAVRVLNDAKSLEEAGAYAVVLEVVPAGLAAGITEKLAIPTIGIGAGPYCSGQVQVVHDMLGLDDSFTPKHARRFLDGAVLIREALVAYREAVQSGKFPTEAESFYLDAAKRAWVEARIAPHTAEATHEGFDAELAMMRADGEFDRL
jgi:3-methyl-2-oxobutanoate hydroxymethyltransferase